METLKLYLTQYCGQLLIVRAASAEEAVRLAIGDSTYRPKRELTAADMTELDPCGEPGVIEDITM
jgi:NADH:ubiquinone oxidoreductase subunit K